MGNDLAINGDCAVALAWKQIDPDVCAAYPITPQTIIVEKFSDYVADGDVGTEFVCVESEHSALTVCTASASAGARTFTATSSQGLAYMWEMLPITSAMRVPLVMAVANRAISGPINIHNDHGDVMSARDTGWIQLFAENVQEAYDNSIIAPRISEHPDVQLPIMTNLDGFILTHAIERMSPLPDEVVKKFVGEHKPFLPLLDYKNPISHGLMDSPEYYYEHKYQLVQAMDKAVKVIEDVFEEFAKISGRRYKLVEEYKCDDADYVAVILGSSYGTIKEAVDKLREKGLKVGACMPRVYRPWPAACLKKILDGKKGVIVMDKHLSVGAYGPMYPEVAATILECKKVPKAYNFIYGLGGKDVSVKEFMSVFETVKDGKAKTVNYLGVKE
ncbi:MAG: pyruvate ferredoxin oxidoreductase [Methanomassiliicoccales archaeon]|nr:pyruvate ferredoxin oxidoreductase [Methanomassiliicoccales archaeon]